MIHPDTELKFINEQVGYGVIATKLIPKGTITYVKDCLEKEVLEAEYPHLIPVIKSVVDKYSYMDEKGTRIISWDIAKYVNHCCECNTISTGWGFEMAIRDIQPGEEITDEYGLFNGDDEMVLNCKHETCRKIVKKDDIDHYHQKWDESIINALPYLLHVDQPLYPLLETKQKRDLKKYLMRKGPYRSVLSLKYQSLTTGRPLTA